MRRGNPKTECFNKLNGVLFYYSSVTVANALSTERMTARRINHFIQLSTTTSFSD